jgi:GWxTD domain-containing protein
MNDTRRRGAAMPSLACIAILAVSSAARAQVEAARTGGEAGKLEYAVDAVSLASLAAGMSRLDVFIQIAYDELTFVKEGDRYRGSYDVTLALSDSTGSLVAERVWTEQVKPSSFDQAVSPRAYSLVQRVFDLPPGRYIITVILQDNETRENRRQVRQIDVARYDVPGVRMSDIMLLSRVTVAGDRRTIVPAVSANLGTLREPATAFFETYADSGYESVRYHITVLDQKKEKVFESDTVAALPQGKNQVFLRFDHTVLPLGEYALYVQAYPIAPGGEGQRSLAVTSRLFVVRWFGLPRGVKDMDLAISQLQYIANDDEMDALRQAKTPEERTQRFVDFWKGRDPNPNTPRNERMEEYYERVEYSNRHFSHYIDGWKTDMGMVFIIFGPPNNVDRHPFDIDAKPYEIWSYYDLNHSFVFVDETGFGDYRLTTPIWEVWQRRE